MHEALYYEKKEHGVRCVLCPQFCRLRDGELGLCGVRKEADGRLYTLNYGVCAAVAMDPVEKKPLYHFCPGRQILSVGTMGCNLSCGFCQNWRLARSAPDVGATRITPRSMVELLEKYRDSVGLAYTYSEPGMWFEHVLDTAKLVRERGYKNVLVTNGYLNEEPLQELLPLIDAFNIDVKAFRDGFYRDHCAGRLEPVKRYVEIAARSAHVELTYLVIPTLNDNAEDIRLFADWVASIRPDIPVHFSRYWPQHKFTLPPTPVATLETLREAAQEKLHYIYLGNVPGSDAAHTFCPGCSERLVRRDGYRTDNAAANGACPRCGRHADIACY